MHSISTKGRLAALFTVVLLPGSVAAQERPTAEPQVQVVGPLYAFGPAPPAAGRQRRMAYEGSGYWQPPVFVPYGNYRQRSYSSSRRYDRSGAGYAYARPWWYRRPGLYAAPPPPRYAARIFTPRWSGPQALATVQPMPGY